ncbi:T9SS type A sorting domain-containing protein [candidate division KSB1 bacterium]|nr:T9SS type A sorting domain-containing protein [candidate division KSB1 bacterium]
MKSGRRLTQIIGLALVVSATSVISSAAVLRVPQEFPTIESALATSLNGDTILLAHLQHAEHIVMPPGFRTIAGEYLFSGDTTDIPATIWTMPAEFPPDSGSMLIVPHGATAQLVGITLTGGHGTLVLPDSTVVGGAIFLDSGSVHLRRCDLHESTAYTGAAIFGRGAPEIILDSTVIRDHVALVQYAITLFDCANIEVRHSRLTRNRGPHGSVFAAVDGTVEFADVLFDSNGAEQGVIREAMAVLRSPARFTDCRFVGNLTEMEGMGHSVGGTQDSAATFERCQFVGNSGYLSPIVAFNESLILRDCIFSDNVSGFPPAALSLGYGAYEIDGCTFEHNQSTRWSCITSNGAVTIRNSEFVGNITSGAWDTTAAISATNGDSYRIVNSLFRGNTGAAFSDLYGDSETIDLDSNYWGDPSGPYNSELNPNGLGDRIFGNVDFEPWLTAPPDFSVPGERPPIADRHQFLAAYPNPFNASTTLTFISQPVRRELYVFNLTGQLVDRLVVPPHTTAARWTAVMLPSGMYFCRLDNASARLILLK